MALINTLNSQCSCGSRHPYPFSSGGNFFPSQRYVLIEIRRLDAPVIGAVQAAAPAYSGGILDFQLNEEQLHLKKSVR